MSAPIALRPTDSFPVLVARIVAFGVPQPQGSKSARVFPHVYKRAKSSGACVGGKAVMYDTHDLDDWRERIHHTAMFAVQRYGYQPVDVACAVTATFYMPRPATAKQRSFPEVAPDLDKLTRAALDGVTGTLLKNDSRVVDLHVFKRYAAEHEPCMVLAVFSR